MNNYEVVGRAQMSLERFREFFYAKVDDWQGTGEEERAWIIVDAEWSYDSEYRTMSEVKGNWANIFEIGIDTSMAVCSADDIDADGGYCYMVFLRRTL